MSPPVATGRRIRSSAESCGRASPAILRPVSQVPRPLSGPDAVVASRPRDPARTRCLHEHVPHRVLALPPPSTRSRRTNSFAPAMDRSSLSSLSFRRSPHHPANQLPSTTRSADSFSSRAGGRAGRDDHSPSRQSKSRPQRAQGFLLEKSRSRDPEHAVSLRLRACYRRPAQQAPHLPGRTASWSCTLMSAWSPPLKAERKGVHWPSRLPPGTATIKQLGARAASHCDPRRRPVHELRRASALVAHAGPEDRNGGRCRPSPRTGDAMPRRLAAALAARARPELDNERPMPSTHSASFRLDYRRNGLVSFRLPLASRFRGCRLRSPSRQGQS